MALYIALTPVIVRVLGPAYGDYVFVISVLSMVMVLSNGGVFTATRKYISEHRDLEDWEDDVFAFYVHVSAAFVVLVAVAGAVGVATGTVDRFGDRFVVYTGLVVLLVAIKSLMNVTRSALMAFKLETVSEPLFAVQVLLIGVVGVSLAYLGWSVVGLLVGHFVATLLVMAGMLVYLVRYVSIGRVLRPVSVALPARELLSFTLLTFVFFLLMESLYHVDILTIRLLVDRQATAHYKAALLSAEFLWIVPIGLQNLLVHSTSELWAEEKYENIQDIATKVTRYNLLLTSLLGVGIAVLSEEFVGFYFGPGFDSAILPLLVLLPGALGFAVARGIFSIGQGKGEMKPLLLAMAGAAGINLVLNVLLIPRFGILGAAIATSAGYGSMVPLHVRAARAIGFDPLADLRLVPIAVTTLTTGVVLVAIERVLTSSLLEFAVIPPVGFAVFSVLAVKTGAIDVEEVRHVTNGFFESVPI